MMVQKLKKRLFHTLIPAVLAALMLPSMAYADENVCSVSIPVELQVSGDNVPGGQSYRLVLEGITPQAPMPETAQLVVEEPGTVQFGAITYQTPNDYQYRIYQSFETVEDFTFDQTVYIATVRVIRSEDGNLEAQIWATNSGANEEKVSHMVFVNQYTFGSGSGGGNGGGGGGGGGSSSGGGSSRVSTPGTQDGPTTIDDQDTALANLENIADEEVPLGNHPILEAIEDVLVPLGLLPKTGDGSVSYASLLAVLAVSGALIVLIMIKRRKRTS